MKISTKGRYAMRIMVDLASAAPGTPVSIRGIAEEHDISVKYLEQIVSVLKNAGLVVSTRGVQGGYNLSQDAKDYLVGDILRAAEGFNAKKPGKASYDTLPLWQQIDDAISNVIDHKTLADVVKEAGAETKCKAK